MGFFKFYKFCTNNIYRGLDFRPKYREACALVSHVRAPVLCLTATATQKIFKDARNPES